MVGELSQSLRRCQHSGGHSLKWQCDVRLRHVPRFPLELKAPVEDADKTIGLVSVVVHGIFVDVVDDWRDHRAAVQPNGVDEGVQPVDVRLAVTIQENQSRALEEDEVST